MHKSMVRAEWNHLRSVEVPEPYHSGKALAFLVMRKKKESTVIGCRQEPEP